LPTIGIAQHPSSIGWMPVMTQLWMNLSWVVNVWLMSGFKLGNPFCKKLLFYMGR
jgi:hypothetical protein